MNHFPARPLLSEQYLSLYLSCPFGQLCLKNTTGRLLGSGKIQHANFEGSLRRLIFDVRLVGGNWCRFFSEKQPAMPTLCRIPCRGSFAFCFFSQLFFFGPPAPVHRFRPDHSRKCTSLSMAQHSATPATNSEPARPRSNASNATRKSPSAFQRIKAFMRSWG